MTYLGQRPTSANSRSWQLQTSCITNSREPAARQPVLGLPDDTFKTLFAHFIFWHSENRTHGRTTMPYTGWGEWLPCNLTVFLRQSKPSGWLTLPGVHVVRNDVEVRIPLAVPALSADFRWQELLRGRSRLINTSFRRCEIANNAPFFHISPTRDEMK
jgi:hypothetical protein